VNSVVSVLTLILKQPAQSLTVIWSTPRLRTWLL